MIIPTHLLYRKKANPPEVLFLGSLYSSEKATKNIPCGTKFSLVLIFAIFPAIRKNTFPHIKITANIFPRKIYSSVKLIFSNLNSLHKKNCTKKSPLFNYNLSLSFRNKAVYNEILVLHRVHTPYCCFKICISIARTE